MKLNIVKLGNKILRGTAKEIPVSEIKSAKIQKLIRNMSDTLRATDDGIGIAAPQVGVLLQIFIASEEALYENENDMNEEARKKTKKDWEHYVFINPRIIKTSKRQISANEGCLSVPGKYGIVDRPLKAKIEAYNSKGKKIQRGASGLLARLFVHETDHLKGILFIDLAKRLSIPSKKSS